MLQKLLRGAIRTLQCCNKIFQWNVSVIVSCCTSSNVFAANRDDNSVLLNVLCIKGDCSRLKGFSVWQSSPRCSGNSLNVVKIYKIISPNIKLWRVFFSQKQSDAIFIWNEINVRCRIFTNTSMPWMNFYETDEENRRSEARSLPSPTGMKHAMYL